MSEKLAIIVIGHQESGKSSVWNKLLVRVKIFTKQYLWKVCGIEEFVQEEKKLETEIFVKASSFEEQGEDIKDEPRIGEIPLVLISVQYVEGGRYTIQYLKEQGYSLVVFWLNPGANDRIGITMSNSGTRAVPHFDRKEKPYFDYLGFCDFLLNLDARICLRKGQETVAIAEEIKEEIARWAICKL